MFDMTKFRTLDDVEALRLCLGMLPPRSPKRAAIVARLDALEA